MRNLLFLLLLVLTLQVAQAQSRYQKRRFAKHLAKKAESKRKGTVLLSLDTIFNKGLPYALLKEKKQLPYHHYTLYGLNHLLLAEFIPQAPHGDDANPYYTVYFTQSGNRVQLEKYYGLKLEQEIVRNELVSDNAVDPRSETLFLLKYRRLSLNDPRLNRVDTAMKDPADPSVYEPVARDRRAKLYFKDGKILQDYQWVGSYKILGAVLRIYLPNNLTVAEAAPADHAPDELEVLSLKDRQRSRLPLQTGKELNDVTAYLCEKGYL